MRFLSGMARRRRARSPSAGYPRTMNEPIYFYSRSSEYGWLSNFSPHGFELDGLYWPTVEHYFQAMKFPGDTIQEKIRRLSSPKEAKKLGRTRMVPIRPDWEHVKEEVMHYAVKAKFIAHEDIRRMLLDTGERTLIENAPGDYYWGCGKTGTGRNRLGVILEQVRRELRGKG